jgi:hypothetical protein
MAFPKYLTKGTPVYHGGFCERKWRGPPHPQINENGWGRMSKNKFSFKKYRKFV